METIILVPGGGGSRLELQGEEIWPPTVLEIRFGYGRTAKLQDSRVKVTGVLDGVPKPFICYEVYKPLQDDLNKIASFSGARRVDFAYDWRKDIAFSAGKLAAKIASCVSNGSNQITLVCHSMGNLLARTILESGDYSSKSWFGKIKRYVGICGPHIGVPVILEYALGLKSWLGVSAADMKTLSANDKYAACYQCLPFQGNPVLWDVQSGSPQVKDFYDPVVAGDLDLNAANLAAAKNLHGKLDFGNRPTGVHYHLIAGSDHTTDEGIELDGSTFYGLRTDYLGDSTIPLWSSAIATLNPRVTPGDHIDVLKSYPFREILYEILTGGTLAPELSLLDQPGVTLSLNSFTYAPHEAIEILIIPDLRTQDVSGTLQITRVVGPEARRFVRYQEQPVVYRGPPISFIRSTLTAPADPGTYRISFSGSHGTSARTSAAFVVSTVATRPQQTRVPLRR